MYKLTGGGPGATGPVQEGGPGGSVFLFKSPTPMATSTTTLVYPTATPTALFGGNNDMTRLVIGGIVLVALILVGLYLVMRGGDTKKK